MSFFIFVANLHYSLHKAFVYLIHNCLLLSLLKRFFTYLLLILFSFQTFETAIIVLNFKINQDIFAEICENKDKPEMECNGKCHLKKQIKEQEENKSKNDQLVIEKEIQCFILYTSTQLPTPIISKNKVSFLFKNLSPITGISDIYHPPNS